PAGRAAQADRSKVSLRSITPSGGSILLRRQERKGGQFSVGVDNTIRTVIFLIAGKLDFGAVNPHAQQPT
ncbi:MAG: hypothetical protein ACOY42_06660, partial [Pseudomonadota bacterium]